MTIPHWKHFEHQADIGVRGFGNSMAEAFEQAALAMIAIVTDLSHIAPIQAIDVACKDTDQELLLVDWLNALVYETATRKILFSRFEVNIMDGQLTARAWGEPINIERHQPAVEIKGATYTELKVYQEQGQWIAQCVVDV
ncbi:MAG: archease [Arenicellales bacterium]|jgi:SHS2 domain-containing protein